MISFTDNIYCKYISFVKLIVFYITSSTILPVLFLILLNNADIHIQLSSCEVAQS